MPRTAKHLGTWQFQNMPKAKLRAIARKGGLASRGFGTPERQRAAVLAAVAARQKHMARLVSTFIKIEDKHGTRAAVIALWRLGKRSAYDAKHHIIKRGQRKKA